MFDSLGKTITFTAGGVSHTMLVTNIEMTRDEWGVLRTTITSEVVDPDTLPPGLYPPVDAEDLPEQLPVRKAGRRHLDMGE